MLIGQSPILTEHIEGRAARLHHRLLQPGVLRRGRARHGPAHPARSHAARCHPRHHPDRQHRQVPGRAGRRHGWAASTGLELLALATGLNARGSTEVIIASIGLSMGALSNQLYTMIVAMAVITTMAMPPTLRWMMGRVPLRDEELQRLEKEEAEEKRERAADGAGAGLCRRQRQWRADRDARRTCSPPASSVLTTVLETPRRGRRQGPGPRRG